MPTTPNPETEYASFEEAKREAEARATVHHVTVLHRITGYVYVVKPGAER